MRLLYIVSFYFSILVFGDEAIEIQIYCMIVFFYFLLFFIFVLPVLPIVPCKQKSLYRKSHNLFSYFHIFVGQNEKQKVEWKEHLPLNYFNDLSGFLLQRKCGQEKDCQFGTPINIIWCRIPFVEMEGGKLVQKALLLLHMLTCW